MCRALVKPVQNVNIMTRHCLLLL